MMFRVRDRLHITERHCSSVQLYTEPASQPASQAGKQAIDSLASPDILNHMSGSTTDIAARGRTGGGRGVRWHH